MSVLVKEDFLVSISGDVAEAVQKRYDKEDYSLMVENFLRFMLPRERVYRGSMLSVAASLRGCAAYSGLVAKSDKEIKAQMYKEKYGIWREWAKFFLTQMLTDEAFDDIEDAYKRIAIFLLLPISKISRKVKLQNCRFWNQMSTFQGIIETCEA